VDGLDSASQPQVSPDLLKSEIGLFGQKKAQLAAMGLGNEGLATAAMVTRSDVTGVDIINSIAVGNKAAAIAAYFSTNVISSNMSEVFATSSSSRALNATLTQSIANSFPPNITAVPEPSLVLALFWGGCLLLVHRRRA
jgi:UDP-N-acetyl-D-mannosaminuronate dehydrogenase